MKPLPTIALAVAFWLLFVAGAEAHSRYLRSAPGQGAIVAKEPNRVDIWFTQDLFRRQRENWILVFGPGGDEVHSGEAHIDDDDRHHMWVELKSPLEPGEYRVEWRNLSAEDGDSDEGEFTFTLDPQADVTSTPMLKETATPFPTATAAATDTVAAAAPAPQNTDEPEGNNNSGGCSLGLTPAFALVAISLGLKRKRK